jgi:phytoene synthase
MSDALRSSYRFCGTLARRQARNFYYSFLLLPAPMRQSMCALYAFMRHTDDLTDEPGDLDSKRRELDRWRASVDRALSGTAAGDWAGLPALADTVARHAIPRRYLDEVLDGVAMDLEVASYARFDELYGYCYHVASAVGLCCIHIWGFRSDGGRAEALAEACGIALQLTNILRDVREDALRGRIYLPGEDLERFGVTPADLAADRTGDRARELFAFEARRAAQYYETAAPLAELVEPVGRPVLRTIVGIYHALLDEIGRGGYDVLSRRVAIRPWRKAVIAARSLPARFGRPTPGRMEVSRF